MKTISYNHPSFRKILFILLLIETNSNLKFLTIIIRREISLDEALVSHKAERDKAW